MSYTLVAMILVENKMLTSSLWRIEHLSLNKDLSAGSDLRWWPSELTNERAPAGADLVHHTTHSYLIFVMGATGGACVNFFWPV